MNSRTSLQLTAVILLLGVAAWQIVRSIDRPRIDYGPYRALGEIAAGEVARVMGGQGTVVLVMEDTGNDGDPVQAAQLQAFRQGLKAHAGIRVRATEAIALDPFVRMSTGGALPLNELERLNRAHSDATAMVFLMAFPRVTDTEAQVLSGTAMKRVVISAALPGYAEMLRSGVLHLAIVPRPMSGAEPTSASGSTSDLRAVFDREYEILRTPEGP